MIFNKKAYESLPKDLQMTLDAVAMQTNLWSLSQAEAGNGAALEELINVHKVNLMRFPDPLLEDLKKMSEEVLEEEAAKEPIAGKVNEAFKKFKKQIGVWGAVSGRPYYDVIAGNYGLKSE